MSPPHAALQRAFRCLQPSGPIQPIAFANLSYRTPAWQPRPPPEALHAGDVLSFDAPLTAQVVSLYAESSRLITLNFNLGFDALWREIYRQGKPIQYSYLSQDLDIWSVQTGYASRPWAMEMPSAGRPLSWELLLNLKAKGVELATLTHGAGVSSSGDSALDARLPLRERFELTQITIKKIQDTHLKGGRVIAVGTSVVRALESNFLINGNNLIAGQYETDLLLTAKSTLQVTNAILTGVHDVSESHFRLLESFTTKSHLQKTITHAEQFNYLTHEFGDAVLIL